MFILDIICVLYGFAWAIGGEKYFGKWKRGLLVLIPSILAGIICSAKWWYYLAILIAFYPAYQLLFFDKAIKLIYPDSGTTNIWQKILGQFLCFINGSIVGLLPAILFYSSLSWIKGIICHIISGLAFIICVFLSNSCKIKLPIDIRIGEVKVFCLADSWWFSCWIYGILVGLCYIMAF